MEHEIAVLLGRRNEPRLLNTEMSTPNGPAPKKGGGMTVREAGQKGGETVKKKYGPEFYEQIGRKGGQATKQAHGHAFYEQIGKKGGKKGGEATRDRYGPNFYEQIGQKGGQKVKQLIEEGKRAAAATQLEEQEKKAS
jgi:general stress protein YciG